MYRHVYRHVCRHVYRHVNTHVWRHVYRNLCRNLYTHVCTDLCIDMCIGRWVDICADMCVDMCAGMCVDMHSVIVGAAAVVDLLLAILAQLGLLYFCIWHVAGHVAGHVGEYRQARASANRPSRACARAREGLTAFLGGSTAGSGLGATAAFRLLCQCTF